MYDKMDNSFSVKFDLTSKDKTLYVVPGKWIKT